MIKINIFLIICDFESFKSKLHKNRGKNIIFGSFELGTGVPEAKTRLTESMAQDAHPRVITAAMTKSMARPEHQKVVLHRFFM